jgi:UDP-N-acetylglucosamine--N-acetylmuramyl-(pentapeptide) pyrophosphoryl-undecaprenol N-acetylglucosamine transferase
VAELAAAGKPALLIPFAAAADDHQRSNAQVMVETGAAVMLEERQLAEPEILLVTLRALLGDPQKLQSMAEHARTQARPGAAERIADRLIELIRR